MKLYCSDFNGILTDLKAKIGPLHLTTPRNADAWVFWQDVLGSYGDLIKAAKKCGEAKPTFVVQHGRGATSDYDKPNSYDFTADYFLAWGQRDYQRMLSLGYGDRVKVVGCPLNTQIKPKVPHEEKVVLFVPVNTGKEEPENLAVYYELLKLKYNKAQVKILDQQAELKDRWDMTTNKACKDFDVVAKLLPWHDKNMYHGRVLVGSQYSPSNNQLIFELLRNVDAVVGVDEGCTEIFAMAHDVPVIIVDGFKYRQYKENGKDFVVTDPYKTKGAFHTDLNGLRDTLEQVLAHPELKRQERAEVAEAEMGISYGNATENIYKFIKEKVSCLSPR
jgi:hypothetical protein